MTVDTLAVEPQTEANDTPEGVLVSSPAVPEVEDNTVAEDPAAEGTSVENTSVENTAVGNTAAKPKKAPAKKAAPKKTKTLELTLTVTGTADGEWHAELKQGSTYLARNLAVAAAAVSRAAKELHEDISTPIDEVIEAAREQQAKKVAALEAELEAARRALAELAE